MRMLRNLFPTHSRSFKQLVVFCLLCPLTASETMLDFDVSRLLRANVMRCLSSFYFPIGPTRKLGRPKTTRAVTLYFRTKLARLFAAPSAPTIRLSTAFSTRPSSPSARRTQTALTRQIAASDRPRTATVLYKLSAHDQQVSSRLGASAERRRAQVSLAQTPINAGRCAVRHTGSSPGRLLMLCTHRLGTHTRALRNAIIRGSS
ncbi:hypothetical protein K402DRAFT_40061 [Aulographum hederae CBS 113979]|uniref:Secreted protein n=1 Tax=Aulographum hederae CBS 113979 TaxID=1176131 RepID=A0A6G1H4B1_9PEZI|nr:hypothetical protein K402DRAFT_40061 [Aulographum hederae CBS 113979]